MIYSSLDSSHRDESNDSKIIPIGVIFAEIAIFAKFQVGSGQLSDPTRYFGSVRVGYPDHGSKFGALIPCSFSYTKIRYDGVSEASKMYVRKNAETKFVTDITRKAFQIREEYKDPKQMLPLSAQEQRRYDNATQCWICKKEFGTQEVWISI